MWRGVAKHEMLFQCNAKRLACRLPGTVACWGGQAYPVKNKTEELVVTKLWNRTENGAKDHLAITYTVGMVYRAERMPLAWDGCMPCLSSGKLKKVPVTSLFAEM